MTENLPPWRSIVSRALHRNRSLPNARYFQLATVDREGNPANRTVVFRGFLNKSNQLQIITDSRSQKLTEINHHSSSEICWYFPKTREQFRITGKITIIDHKHEKEKARLTVWQNLSDAAKQQFTWPHPGENLTENKEDFKQQIPSTTQPVPNFILLLFNPEKVDHLELKGSPHQRTFYYLDDEKNWIKQLVNP
ncbi:Npun_F5749 family FMN-dependent PPOX-type flavoprotein [Crocosphaera sp. Alani8]|uniref:Npun_F5749 family FMN-dependent PPOX-type flavoprotein n=1 Tax=Crocosphaera sp. Alani8 TaxID=3038952 RepID=UPI00313D4621